MAADVFMRLCSFGVASHSLMFEMFEHLVYQQLESSCLPAVEAM